MYNRYLQARGGRAEGAAEPESPARPGPREKQVWESPAGAGPAGLKTLLSGLWGSGADSGDLFLCLILLLLYLEQEDEELLIVLAALVVLGLGEEDQSGRRKS